MQSYLNQIKDADLIDLVQSQHPSVIDQVLQSYSSDDVITKLNKINKTDHNGYTALHKACARGIPELVELLLINGADINTRNSGGETSVLLAAKRGNPIVLKYLKDYGASMNVVDFKGQGLAHHAIYNDNALVLLWIETSTELSLNSKDKCGQTPLHLASSLGKLSCIRFLLRKSRSNVLDMTFKTHDTCLHLAIANHQLHCIPFLLFHSTKKQSYCTTSHLFDDESTSVVSYKNSNNKTPIDLFMEQSDDYKTAHRSFWYFFKVLQMTSLTLIEMNFYVFRVFLFLFPFLAFSLGIFLALLINDYRILVFLLTSLLCIVFVKMQTHRVSNIDTCPNPIFAGAYVAGIFHDIICFVTNIYPIMRGNEWQIVVTLISIPLLTVSYLRLILCDSGRLKLTEISKTNFSEFVNDEIKQQKLKNCDSNTIALDRFCNVCEALPVVGQVKHCKICNVCIVDLDHHCLFLMKCIGRNNLRNFIFLIMISLLLIGVFIDVAVEKMITICGPLSGANPFEVLMCCYRSETWIATVLVFNIISWIWAFGMLCYQLSMISYNTPAYFHDRNMKSTPYQRMFRIVYFLIHGAFFYERHGDRILLPNV